MPFVDPDVSTVTVPRAVFLPPKVSKKLTCPPRVAGATVAVRVTFVPGAAGLAGLAARLTPDTTTVPMAAGSGVTVQTAEKTSSVWDDATPKDIDWTPTGTTVPTLPVTGTVAERLDQLAVRVLSANG